MQPNERRPFWEAALQNTLLVILLTGCQLLWFIQVDDSRWPVPYSSVVIGSCALSYTLIPGYASLLAAQETGKLRSGFFTGCAIGLVSMVISLALMIWQIESSASGRVGLSIFITLLYEGGNGLIWTLGFSTTGAAIGQNRYRARLQALQAESNTSNEAT